jgi:hypothetical protein
MIALGWAVLGEQVGMTMALGAALVTASVVGLLIGREKTASQGAVDAGASSTTARLNAAPASEMPQQRWPVGIDPWVRRGRRW